MFSEVCGITSCVKILNDNGFLAFPFKRQGEKRNQNWKRFWDPSFLFACPETRPWMTIFSFYRHQKPANNLLLLTPRDCLAERIGIPFSSFSKIRALWRHDTWSKYRMIWNCNVILTTTKHCKLLVDVRRLQFLSQLATQLILCLRYVRAHSC